MKRTILRLFRSVLTVYALVCLGVFLLQRRLQYLPDPSPVAVPRGGRFADIEPVELRTSDNRRIFSWFWPGTLPVTLVVFHGNAGHRGDRLFWMESFHERGYGVFLLDYRGYGGSEGSPSEQGLYRDGEAALAWLRNRGDSELVYLGQSLGSGVAVELAARHRPAALILQAAFSSALDVARRTYFFLPVRLLMLDRFDSIGKIGRVQAPILFVHGQRDRIVPLDSGRALFEAAPEPREWYVVEDAGHNDLVLVGGTAYVDRVDRFLRQHVTSRAHDRDER